MNKKRNFRVSMLSLVLLLSLTPALCSGGNMGDFTADVSISMTYLHEWMPSIAYNPIENEFMVLWHTTGVREPGGENMYSLHGQRVSPEGELTGAPFSPLLSIGPGRRILPKPAYNIFTNQYMVAFCMEQPETTWDPFVTRIDHDGTILSDPIPLSEQPPKANHPFIAFNSVRRQYLIAYNDSRNGDHDIFGVIVDENGNVVKEDFSICTAVGQQQNPYISYNPTDDTYLMNWEDFRHVPTWTENGDIYGALLDGDGNMLVSDIPMCDDYGMDNEGGQWLNNIAYNPDRNEFLVCWFDTRPTLNLTGIVGRFFSADGTPAGPDFTLADAPGAQLWSNLVYIQEKKMYFLVWMDERNSEIDEDWSDSDNWDIYAKWLSPSGESIGPDIPLCTAERSQTYPVAAYSPVEDRLLIAWRDELEEDVPSGTGSGHVTESGGNIMGKVYGVPSFFSGRVVEQGSGEPVEGASVTVVGLGYERTVMSNIGGWFNLPERFQSIGNYVAVIRKKGYLKAIETSIYKGEPLKITVELNKKE